MRLREVIVWKGRMAAQIRADWNGAEVTFFDTRFVLDRSRYAAGREYDFTLAALPTQPARRPRGWCGCLPRTSRH